MFSDLLFRLRALFRRDAMEAEMDEELRSHFENQVEKLVASGLPREEATRRARLGFGGYEQLKEECRDARASASSRHSFRICATRCGCCATVPASPLLRF